MRLKYKFEIVNLDDQTIAVPMGDNVSEFRGVIKTNDTAARIIGMLNDDTNEGTIIKTLSEEYEASTEAIADDVRQIIKEFQERGLLIQ